MIGSGAFWQTLRRETTKRRDTITEEIANGMVSGFNEYHKKVGEIASLNWLLDKAKEILGEVDKPRKQEEEKEEIVL